MKTKFILSKSKVLEQYNKVKEIGDVVSYSSKTNQMVTKILEEELPKNGIEVLVVPFSSVRSLPKVIRHIAYFFLVFKKGFGGFQTDYLHAQDLPLSFGYWINWAIENFRRRKRHL